MTFPSNVQVVGPAATAALHLIVYIDRSSVFELLDGVKDYVSGDALLPYDFRRLGRTLLRYLLFLFQNFIYSSLLRMRSMMNDP